MPFQQCQVFPSPFLSMTNIRELWTQNWSFYRGCQATAHGYVRGKDPALLHDALARLLRIQTYYVLCNVATTANVILERNCLLLRRFSVACSLNVLPKGFLEIWRSEKDWI